MYISVDLKIGYIVYDNDYRQMSDVSVVMILKISEYRNV
jgi:hypothetical protein